MARSIQNLALSLEPLASDEELLALVGIANNAEQIASTLSQLYNGVAPKAFGPESEPKRMGPMG